MTTEQRFWTKVKKTKTCWLWIGATNGTSCRGNFRPGGMREKVSAHRFSWFLAYGEIRNGLYVLHKCDNPRCVRPDHLFLGTQADNIRDMDKKGRRGTTLGMPGLKGTRNPGSKLNEKQVIEIRTLYKNGTSQSLLAKRFKICQTNVSWIVRGKIWSHVPND